MSEANLTKSINYASKNHPHNLKVGGSNPTPATKSSNKINGLGFDPAYSMAF